MSEAMAQATRLAQTVYAAFFAAVVEARVLEEREGGLSGSGAERLAKRTHIDTRVVRLMAVSGKGGWDADPVKNERYAKNTNVSLLDHLLSVARGAMVLYALDCLGRNPGMDEARLDRHLRVIAALAFLHDLDKMLGLPRGDELPTGPIEDALVRLGESAATIQRKPFAQASANEEMLVFNLCLDFAIGARAAGQADAAPLVNGIASELEINLVRKQKAAARQHRDEKTLREGCLALAGQFVEDIWLGVLRSRAPTQRARRILGSIYRMAFLQAAQSNKPTDSHP